ncbi:hypothetical protein PCC7424_5158 [Gloeothece citriformis PCC 7424]|uniref:SCP domain-containing protein n=2 Tax=Gloeothece TaxID=28070 RepID=B7KH21_GLOC7|nr:hypothetical protein PCC7424_5158 [Gloeothece citriformis PCC 7424]
MTLGLSLGIYSLFVEITNILKLFPLLAQTQYEIELLNLTNTQKQKVRLVSLQMSSQLNQAQDLIKYQQTLISQTPSSTPPVEANKQECEGEKILSALICPGDELNAQENQLYELINQYRLQKGLSSIPLSPSLNRVANRHLQDLQSNEKLYNRNGRDWRFGWSDCPYDGNNPSTFSCMWAAPQRLKTAYSGKGYELLCGGKGKITPQEALRCWQKSNSNHNVILNGGEWQNYQWNAIGIAIDKGYANLWFGQEFDRTTQTSNPPKPLPRPGRIW